MSSVYVFGPIYISGEDYLPVYKKLNQVSSKHFDKVIGTYPDFWDTKETPREFWDRTYSTIINCDLFIAECSSPSHGVGMELQMGQENDIPCIVLVKASVKGFENSTMVNGLPNLRNVVRYKDEQDLLEQVESLLQSIEHEWR